MFIPLLIVCLIFIVIPIIFLIVSGSIFTNIFALNIGLFASFIIMVLVSWLFKIKPLKLMAFFILLSLLLNIIG